MCNTNKQSTNNYRCRHRSQYFPYAMKIEMLLPFLLYLILFYFVYACFGSFCVHSWTANWSKQCHLLEFNGSIFQETHSRRSEYIVHKCIHDWLKIKMWLFTICTSRFFSACELFIFRCSISLTFTYISITCEWIQI